MKYKELLFIVLILSISACVSITDITPAGKDTFMIAGSDPWEANAGVNIKADLYQSANSHCERSGKKLMPLNDSAGQYSAQLTFRCLSENDPEFSRPNMQPVPDVRIETKQ